MEEVLEVLPSFPPLWNAWWCGGCPALHSVGDGGALVGGCTMCGDPRPVRNDVMLDPDQVAQLKETPGLSYDALFPGDAGASQFFSRKTSGMTDRDQLLSSPQSSKSSSDNDDDEYYVATDQEVSKFSFIEKLHHYMERWPIGESNRKSVELAIMVGAGSVVREMGTMTKDTGRIYFIRSISASSQRSPMSILLKMASVCRCSCGSRG